MTSDHTPAKLSRLSDTHAPGSYGVRLADQLRTPKHFPRADRLRLKFRVSEDFDDESEDLADGLQEIVGLAWNMHRVSPLHRFKYNEIRFKQYGLRLRERLAATNKGSNNIQYKTTFSRIPGLTQTVHDCEAIKLEVKCSRDGQSINPSYLGLLLSWGETQPLTENDVVRLPLLLCRGTKGLTASVHMLLESFFDCSITQLLLAEEDLMWLSAMLPSTCPLRQKPLKIDFFYSVPSLSKHNNLILCIPVKTLVETWNRIHKPDAEDVTHSEIKALHDGIMEHVKLTLGLDLGYCRLDRIKFAEIEISLLGKFKVSTPDLTDIVLSFVYSLSLLIEDSAPTVSVKND